MLVNMTFKNINGKLTYKVSVKLKSGMTCMSLKQN